MGPGSELGRRETAEARLGAVGVVVPPPFFDDPTGLWQASEHVLVQAFVAEAAVQVFHEGVLHRLAGRDVVPFDAGVFLPLQDSPGRQFSPVVAYDHQRTTAQTDDFVQGAYDASAGEC